MIKKRKVGIRKRKDRCKITNTGIRTLAVPADKKEKRIQGKKMIIR